MKIGLFQYDIRWEDKDENKLKISSILDDYKADLPDWIIFPEMTLSAFSMIPDKTTLSDEDINFFRRIAKSKDCFVSFGGVKDLKNTIFTLDKSGNIINEYSKLHLFSYGNETSSYKPGNGGLAFSDRSFDLGGLRVLPSICYDLRFSYMFWDHANKTDLSFIIASWPASRREHWMALLKARAIENQTYVLGVNRIGEDKDLKYSGDSLLIDPMGKEILHCEAKEGLFLGEIDKKQISSVREKFPFIKDRKR